jgi:respiratory burst oxidase
MQWLKGSVFFLPLPDVGAGWCKVEKKFEKLTATTDGYLPLALFAK